MNKLSYYLIQEILSFLDYKCIIRLELVDNFFKKLMNNDQFVQ